MSAELQLSETPDKYPYHDMGRYRPERRFLSRMDREYIRALLALGYQGEAADLVQKAYSRGVQRPTGEMPLLTIYDLEYIEMLLVVGRRRVAMDVVLDLMKEYELASGARTAGKARTRLDREYEATMRAIELDGRLPPEEVLDGSEERGSSILRRILSFILGR